MKYCSFYCLNRNNFSTQYFFLDITQALHFMILMHVFLLWQSLESWYQSALKTICQRINCIFCLWARKNPINVFGDYTQVYSHLKYHKNTPWIVKLVLGMKWVGPSAGSSTFLKPPMRKGRFMTFLVTKIYISQDIIDDIKSTFGSVRQKILFSSIFNPLKDTN